MSELKAETLYNLLCESVKKCVAGNSGVAIQLSGGLDSSVLQAIGKFERCYCVTFPEVDNLSLAEMASKGATVIPVTFTRDEMLDVALPEVARLTKGNGTWSQCCQWFLGRAMAADGVKIVINGEGSDELFGGYARYRILNWLEQMIRDPHLREYAGIIQSTVGTKNEWFYKMISRTSASGNEFTNQYFRDELPLTKQIAKYDEEIGLTELIGFERVIANAHGIIHKWPYMDSSVVEFAHTLDEGDKITSDESKHILRAVARKLGVHPNIVNEVTKRGLFVPTEWRDPSEPKWSRKWFDSLMAAEWNKQNRKAA